MAAANPARTGATGYADILTAPHAARLLAGTLVGRLPCATAPIAIVLLVRDGGGGYSFAGVLAAVYGVANAVGQPLLGRAVDLYGQPRVQLPAAVVSALGVVLLVAAGTGSPPLACAAVAVSGLFTPPLEGGLRALWPSVLGREERVHRAYAMDAVAQEVMFTAGPLLVTLLVARDEQRDEQWARGEHHLLGDRVHRVRAVHPFLTAEHAGPQRRPPQPAAAG